MTINTKTEHSPYDTVTVEKRKQKTTTPIEITTHNKQRYNDFKIMEKFA